MRRTHAILASLLLASVALAGCTDGEDAPPTTTTPPETTPSPTATTPPATTTTPTSQMTPPTTLPVLDSTTYTLTSVGIPAQAKPGAKFNFTLYANGTVIAESDHIGAHYANNDTVDPPAAGRKDCEHQGGTLGGEFVVACTMHEQGTWYVWGHARINDSGELRNWWTGQPAIVKVRDYNLTLTGVPTNAVLSGANFSVTVNITGVDNVTTDHIGIHYWNATTEEPSLQNAQGGCEHVAGGAVGSYTVKCAITNSGIAPKDFFLRGHLRIAESGTTLNWWSAESKVTIGPSLPTP